MSLIWEWEQNGNGSREGNCEELEGAGETDATLLQLKT